MALSGHITGRQGEGGRRLLISKSISEDNLRRPVPRFTYLGYSPFMIFTKNYLPRDISNAEDKSVAATHTTNESTPSLLSNRSSSTSTSLVFKK